MFRQIQQQRGSKMFPVPWLLTLALRPFLFCCQVSVARLDNVCFRPEELALGKFVPSGGSFGLLNRVQNAVGWDLLKHSEILKHFVFVS